MTDSRAMPVQPQRERQPQAPPLVLASASPRRRELLAVLTTQFSVEPSHVDESILEGESPADYVERISFAKAEAVAARRRDCYVLGADTSVILDGACLGKPADPDEARRMLAALSGRWHEVFSGIVLAGFDGRRSRARSVTRVHFDALPADWIERYVESGEPMDKAGAYAVQGRAAAWIKQLEGSYSGVVGLPLYETAQLLREAQLI